jgi:hypothetical protein
VAGTCLAKPEKYVIIRLRFQPRQMAKAELAERGKEELWLSPSVFIIS